MTEEIIRKLTAELLEGIDTEPKVVYLLVQVRKLIERDGTKSEYPALVFHCDWAVHAMLDRAGAKNILEHFNAAHPLLKEKIELHDLPAPLRNEIYGILPMERFREQLSRFLESYSLPSLSQPHADGWPHFLHLYGRVVEDIPLVLKQAADDSRNIAKATVHCQPANETMKHSDGEELFFKITWRIFDKSGQQTGELFSLNSYSLDEGSNRAIDPP